MPKTAKKGFTYFRFETDHFYDPKVKRLKNKFGMEGWGVFHFIVNEIYRVEGCYMVMDADGLFDISDYSRMDEKKVSDIIDYCAELGLFNKELWQDKQILTSEEIQELYVGICKAIHRKPGIPESILLLETEPSPESATIPHATCEQQDTPAHECGSPASLPEDGKEIRQAVTRIRTLFAAEKELREEADKTRENKPYKIKENKIFALGRKVDDNMVSQGLVLALFHRSDLSIQDIYEINEPYADTEVKYNEKAMSIFQDKIIFPMYKESGQSLQIFSIRNTIEPIREIPVIEDYILRSIVLDSKILCVGSTKLYSYDTQNFDLMKTTTYKRIEK